MKIGICDTDLGVRFQTVARLEREFNIDDKNVTITCYMPNDVMFDIDDGSFDCDIFITEIVFSDLYCMGTELVKRINKAVPACRIIYYTRGVPPDVDVYETTHVNCMIKGLHEDRLVNCIKSIAGHAACDAGKDMIEIHFDRTVTRLLCSDIRFIRIENRVTKYYTREGMYYEYRPLAAILEALPEGFIRCHNAVIVNRAYVRSFNHTAITMDDGEELKIGRSYSKNFAQSFGCEEE